MRLGLIGPAQGDLVGLARAARVLYDDARAERVLYLAADGALDRVVSGWARTLVGGEPSADAVFERAATLCAEASADAIDAFVGKERALLELKAFVTLPEAPARTIEMFDGRVVLFVFDKSTLDEEDIAAAAVLVFGKSPMPLIKRVGTRIFVSPGALGPSSGRAILDDSGGGLRLETIDERGVVVGEESLAPGPPASKMRVQGEPGRP